MGTDHRGVTETLDRKSASAITAPKPQQRVEARQPARIEHGRQDTGNRAKNVTQTQTPVKPPSAPKAAPVSSPHVPVTPASHTGASKITPPNPAVLDQVFAQDAPVRAIESKPVLPAAAPKAPEAVPAVVSAQVEEVVDTTRAGLNALLAEIAGQEPDYPKEGDKAARAQWMSESLVKLARTVLNKRPKVDALVADSNARNDLMSALSAKLKKDLGKKYDTTPMPRFLRR